MENDRRRRPARRAGSTPWLLVALTLASTPAAQRQFEERAPERYVPLSLDRTGDVVAVDVDDDGDLDLVVANQEDEPTRLLLNDGQGRFEDVTAQRLPADADESIAVAAGDVDGNGSPDLVIGNLTGDPQRLYLNDGTGTFTDVTATNLPARVVWTRGMALVDVDDDDDLDLVLAASSGDKQTVLYLNDGSGVFTDATATNLPVDADVSFALAVGDVDGNGSPDLYVANLFQDRLYLNDGSGVFTDATATHLPSESLQASSVALVDVDGDTDLDAFVGHYDEEKLLLLNDGTGVFAPGGSLPSSAAWAADLAFADLDQNGTPDLLIGHVMRPGVGGTRQDALWRNDGGGTFTDVSAQRLPVDEDATYGVLLADLDGDGSLDAYAGNDGQDRLYLNDGQGVFVDAAPSPIGWGLGGSIAAIATLDADGDGDPDLVTGGGEIGLLSFGASTFLHPNDGTGRFGDRVFLAGVTNVLSLAAGDVNGDQVPDLVLGTASLYDFPSFQYPQENRVLVNDGAGGFTWGKTRLPADTDETFGLALGDVDGDGDLDLVAGNYGQANRLYANDGNGFFADVTTPRYLNDPRATRAVVLGDLDGDADLDLVVANEYQQNRTYTNGGEGLFSDATVARMPVDSDATRALALGDLDGDDDLDLVLANQDETGLYLNDGAGVLGATSERIPPHGSEAWAVSLGDVDDDGDLDVVTGTRPTVGTAENHLYLNDGTAHFAEVPRLPADPQQTLGLLLADLDGDRDLDLVVANEAMPTHTPWPSRVLTNRQRQLRAPLLALLGRPYELEVSARPGYGATAYAAKVFLGSGLLAHPLQLAPLEGSLYVAPPYVSLPVFLIPASTGSAVQTVALPLDPAFLGLTLHAQAVLAGPGTGYELTGHVADTVRF